VSLGLDSVVPSPSRVPVRTCTGCRQRAGKSELLRVTARDGLCLPDPRSRHQGRGAYLHPTLECLAAAERRRALPRALRVPGPLDTSAVRAWLEAGSGTNETVLDG
jgi:predicted RNA-binding protein YlxR (DUF448 family)